MQDFKLMFQNKHPRYLLPLVLTLAWSLVDLVSLFWGGFYGFDVFLVIGLLVKLAILFINGWFILEFFQKDRRELYWIFRKYVGYAIVLGYGGINLPIMSWQNTGAITQDQATWLWLPCGFQVLFMMVIWVSLWLKKSQVFWGVITPEEAKDKKLLQSNLRARKRPLGIMILENVDMFVQTIFIVIVLQLFLVQLYVIPSESMVPTMLINDRPLVVKTADGPIIPMTNIKLPELVKVDRGQIVVFESPVYQSPSLGIKVIQDFVFYMTLSLVNLDREENGDPKVRFIVKRVTGVPGEKLMMVDDVLYVKTAADQDFHPQEQDKLYRHTDLFDQNPEILSQIRQIHLTKEMKAMYVQMDNQKNNLDLQASIKDLHQLASQLRQALSSISEFDLVKFDVAVFNNNPQKAENYYATIYDILADRSLRPWQSLEANSRYILRHILATPRDQAEFLAFIDSNFSQPIPAFGNLYQKSSFAFNLIAKKLTAEMYLYWLQQIKAGTIQDGLGADPKGKELFERFNDLIKYMDNYDSRNFEEFPGGANEYIPEGKYFLMGDNRYGSLDFRFNANQQRNTRLLSSLDPHSLVYKSMLAPRLLDRRNILGHVVARLYPFTRFGAITP